MPSLHVLKGPNEGSVVAIESDRFSIGRNPDCGVVIPMTSVSREHALILHVQGKYFIEDMKSRNKTFVNNQEITNRTLLKDQDRIRICDFVATFVEAGEEEEHGAELEGELAGAAAEEEEEEESVDATTVEAKITPGSNLLLEMQPADKLRGFLEISGNLSKTLELDTLLPRIADSLFQLFRQADRFFLIMAGDEGAKLMPRLVKTRRATDETNARFSRSIVKQCLENGEAFLSDDASRDDRFQLSQSVVDFRIRSVMCVPLMGAGGKAFGVIQLDTQDRSKKFTQDDLKLLWGVANHAATALENAKLHQETVLREKLKRDLELAQQVQLSFLPRQNPKVAGYEFFAQYEAAQAVGGDYYGFIPLPEGRWAVAVGDVAGKGVPAALLMAKLSSDTRASLLSEGELARSIGRLNDLLYEFTSQMDRFVTLAAVLLDPASHKVTLVSAGHPSPLLYRARDQSLAEAMPRDTVGLPLGMIEGVPYDSCQVTLEPGDSLLLFTDGISEAMDVQNVEFGMEGIHKAVKVPGESNPKVLVERLHKAVQKHATGRPPHDDLTVVGFGRMKEGTA